MAHAASKAIEQALVAIRETATTKQGERAAIVEQLRVIDAELKQLTIAERALDPELAASKPVRETSVDSVRAVMRARGRATMSEVSAAIGKPKNTAKHGLQRLEKDGEVRRTGETEGRSPVYELIVAAA